MNQIKKVFNQVEKVHKFLEALCRKGVITSQQASGGELSYRCQDKSKDDCLYIFFGLTPYYYYKNTYLSSFDKFFELLHPEVKKHFIYHLDLFE